MTKMQNFDTFQSQATCSRYEKAFEIQGKLSEIIAEVDTKAT